MTTDPTPQQPKKPGRLAVLAIIIIVLIALFSLVLLFNPQFWTELFGRIDLLIAEAGPLGGLVIIGLAVVHSVVFFPMELLAIAAGVAYGFWLGTFFMWLGSMLAACLCFALARRLGRPFVIRFLNAGQTQKLDDWLAKAGITTLLVSRLLPIVSFNLVNYAAGLTSISWFTYLWTTAIGIIPILALSVFFGTMMAELPLPVMLAVSGGIIALILGIHFWQQRRKNQP